MKIREAYEIMQEASGIKVGDKVRCLRHFESNEMGSQATGSKGNSPFLAKKQIVDDGAIGIVEGFYESHVWVMFDSKYRGGWNIPFFVLEVIEPAKTIEVKYFCDGKDITDSISEETKQNLHKGE